MDFPPDFEFIRLKPQCIGTCRTGKPICQCLKAPLLDSWPIVPALSLAQYHTIVGQGRNIGVRLRRQDLVIDIDPRNGGSIAMLGIDIYDFPVCETPSGGWHVYMRLPDGATVRHTVPAFGKGIEFKSFGRQVVAPGSLHPNGGRYEWNLFCSTDFNRIVPAVLFDRIKVENVTTASAVVSSEWTAEQLEGALKHLDVTEFSDHDAWFSMLCACHEATGGEGEDEFVAWSTGDELYEKDEKIIRARWRSLKSGKSGNAGAGTLLHILVEKGVTDVYGGAAIDDFEPEPASTYIALGGVGMSNGPVSGLSNGPVDMRPMDVHNGSAEPDEPRPLGTKISALQDMNERFYAVQEDGKLRILELRLNEELKIKEWIKHDRRSFLEVCQSLYHYPAIESAGPKGKSIITPLAQIWIDKNIKGKRVFPGGIVFMPEINAERVGDSLNLWRGFAYTPVPGDWNLLKQVIKDVLVSGDEESYEYVLNWLARAVQYPHIPAGTVCVFKGPKGIGKGWLGRTFVSLFGTHGQHVGNSGSLTGRFNASLRDCVALFADEAYWAGDKAGESTFKQLVTEPTILYEAKGLMPKSGRNCIHILMASNLDWVIPAGLDNERRFAMFEANEEKKSFEFFAALAEQLDNGGRAGMLYELLHRDISQFRVHVVPQTRALAEQKIESMDVGEQWLFQLLMSGDWGGLPVVQRTDFKGNTNLIFAHDLQNSFLERIGNRRNGHSIEIQIGIALRKFIPSLRRIRIARPDERIDIPNARPWAYQVPSIEDAKIKFNSLFGRDMFREDN